MDKNKLRKSVGTKISEAMKSKGIPALVLSSATGITQSAIYSIESGRNVTVYTLYRLAKGLNCEVSDLIPKMDEL